MKRARQGVFKGEGILRVVFDPDLGLCVELGDKKVDNEVYGFGPTQDFVRAMEKEISFQIRNMGGLSEHPTLRKVHKRFRRGLKKRNQVSVEPKTSKIVWGSFPEDPYVALEEVGKILGLTESELNFFLALLTKAEDGHLCFHVGNTRLEFSNYSFDEKEVVLEVEVEKEKTTSSVKYRLSAGDNYELKGDTE